MSEDLAQAVAAEVRRLLDERRWTGRELARRTGLAHNTLAVKVRGERPLDVNEVDAIAAALGIPAAQLIARADAVRSHPSG